MSDIVEKYLGKRNPMAPWVEPDEEAPAVAEAVEAEPVEEKKPLPLKLHQLQRINLSKALKK